jgi:ABC-2 type transport system permease protein
MRDFLKACSAEVLKLKRTLALWMALLAPMVIVALQFCMVLRVPPQRLKAGLWPAIQSGVMGWSILMLPLTAALLTALLNGIEHREGNWKLMFALPVPRWSIYAAKVVAAHALIVLASLVLWAGLIAAGFAAHAILPGAPFGPPPLWPLLKRVALPCAASGMLLAIHLWVSARAKSFTVPLGLGVAAVLVSLVALNDSSMKFWPWMFPANTAMNERWLVAVVFGVGGGLVASALGAWDICRRDVR